MAKRASEQKEGESGRISNVFDGTKVPDFVSRVENLQGEIDAIMEAAKSECAPLREDIGEVKKEAHEAGIPRKELNAKIQERRLLSKARDVRAGLNGDQQDVFDRMSQALGDLEGTPLGAASKH